VSPTVSDQLLDELLSRCIRCGPQSHGIPFFSEFKEALFGVGKGSGGPHITAPRRLRSVVPHPIGVGTRFGQPDAIHSTTPRLLFEQAHYQSLVAGGVLDRWTTSHALKRGIAKSAAGIKSIIARRKIRCV